SRLLLELIVGATTSDRHGNRHSLQPYALAERDRLRSGEARGGTVPGIPHTCLELIRAGTGVHPIGGREDGVANRVPDFPVQEAGVARPLDLEVVDERCS